MYMRCAGYTYKEVGNAIYKQAKSERGEQEHRNWEDYAQRMVNYSFGLPGDIDLAAFNPTQKQIQSFHGEAEKIEAERTQEKQSEQAPQYRMRLR
jgi:hypothetical protein